MDNHKVEIKPNFLIRWLMRYLIGQFKKSTAKNFLVWGLRDGITDMCYRLEIGLDNEHTLIRGREEAIKILTSAITLGNEHTYPSGLWDALRALSPSIASALLCGIWTPEEMEDLK